MRVYYTGEKAQSQPSFIMNVCPAKHLEGSGELPGDWVDDKNVPVEFLVEFKFGQAEVPDSVGRYLIKHGFAKKTRLIMPAALAA